MNHDYFCNDPVLSGYGDPKRNCGQEEKMIEDKLRKNNQSRED